MLITAGAGETLGWPAIAAAGGEAELFYAVTADGGTRLELQHLSVGGGLMGDVVKVAATMASLPATPLVSVASNGSSVDCCWEDQGPAALPDSPSCSAALSQSLVRCASVRVGGTMVDWRADGGFTDCGNQPVVTFGTGAPMAVYVVPAATDIGVALLYSPDFPWAIYAGSGSGPLAVAPVAGGVEILARGDGGIGYFFMFGCGPDGLCSDYLVQEVPDTSNAGPFAVAATGTLLGIAIERTDGVTSLTVDTDAGLSSLAVSLTSAGEQPIGPVAAGTCGSVFGYAYAIDGGDVRFRETAFDGTLANGGSVLVANLGANAQSLALSATDGGLLIAVGTPSEIGVYFVSCP